MSDQAAQAKDAIPADKVRWIVQADYHLASENKPQQHWFQVIDTLEDALKRGATEVRIRPVKETRHAG